MSGEMIASLMSGGPASAPVQVSTDLDFETNLVIAAHGDGEALRALANSAYEAMKTWRDDPILAAFAFSEAIAYARLAEAQGEPRDSEILVFLYASLSEWLAEIGRNELSRNIEAKALNLASDLADDGNEAMADMIARSAEALSPETFREAKRQKEASQ